MFATLDSTLRKIQLPNYGNAILADTVGFIRQLPHQLVEAFRATLEETVAASLLLHVVDCNNDERLLLIDEVNKVLAEIGAADIPVLLVFNKVDLLDEKTTGVERDAEGRPVRAWVSAHTGAGVPELLGAIGELLGEDFITTQLTLLPGQGRQRARFYELGVVQAESVDDDGNACLRLHMPRADLLRLVAEEGIDISAFDPVPYMRIPPDADPSTNAQVDEAV